MEAARIFRELTNRSRVWRGQRNGETRERLGVGPALRGGSSYTLNSTGGSNSQRFGASFRIIANMADRGQSVGVNAPGSRAIRDARSTTISSNSGRTGSSSPSTTRGRRSTGGPGCDRLRPGGV